MRYFVKTSCQLSVLANAIMERLSLWMISRMSLGGSLQANVRAVIEDCNAPLRTYVHAIPQSTTELCWPRRTFLAWNDLTLKMAQVLLGQD
jgi:hypothetical protein